MITPNMATMLCFVTCDAGDRRGRLGGAAPRRRRRVLQPDHRRRPGVDQRHGARPLQRRLGREARGGGAGAARPGHRRRAPLARPLDRRRRRGLHADDEAARSPGRTTRAGPRPSRARSPTRRWSRRRSTAATPTGAASCRPSVRRSAATATAPAGADRLRGRRDRREGAAGGAGRSRAGPARRDHAPAARSTSTVALNGPGAEATVYFSDLTHDYVTLNAEYST